MDDFDPLIEELYSLSHPLLVTWACECAERALDQFEFRNGHPDERSRDALAVARRWARGEARQDEAEDLAGAGFSAFLAASAAGRRGAACVSVSASSAAGCAASNGVEAATFHAKAAARGAALATVTDRAKADERAWQEQRLRTLIGQAREAEEKAMRIAPPGVRSRLSGLAQTKGN